MVELYVGRIKRGKMTIDEVPILWRIKVLDIINSQSTINRRPSVRD